MASKDELVAELADLRTQVKTLDAEYSGEKMPDDAAERWNKMNTEIDDLEATINEIEAREERVRSFDGNQKATERPEQFNTRQAVGAARHLRPRSRPPRLILA